MSSGEIAPENDGNKENKLLHESAEAHSLSSVAKERSVFKGICNTSTDEIGEVENSALPPWSCSVCTFFNMSEMIECSMCLTPRRRSQRLSARKILPEDNESKSKSSRKRRHKRDAAKMDGFQRVDLACNSTLKRVHEKSSKITVTDRLLESGDIGLPSKRMGTACCDADTTLKGDKGSAIEPVESSHCVPDGPLESNDESLTPEPMEIRHDNLEGGYNCASKEHSTALKDTSNSANPRPRKRLKLEECEDVNTPDIYDFSEDLAFCSNNSSFISESPLLASASQKGSLHCAVSKDVVKNEKSEHQPVLLDKSNCDKQCDLFERTDHSVDATSEISLAVSVELSSEVAVVEETNSRLHVREGAQCKVIDNLEELKAAAEEVFISEWEDDDDSWWEEDSSSEQSSYPSSGDTTSNSQSRSTKLNTGFTKCSDLYSISELKNRLQSTPEQSKAHASTGVGNNQRLELFPEQKVLAAPLHQENCVPAVDEEEMDEPEEIPESIELKFCLSFYTERVYLYNEDNKPLGINFCMSDVLNGNTEDLPTILRHDYNLKQVKRFLGAWKRMGEGKKRVLRKSALVFDDPLEAYERARKGATRESSYVRHPSKETRIQKVVDAAEEIGGNVRVVKKPRITTKKKNSRTEKCQRTNDGQSRATSTPSSSTLCTDPTRETNSTTKEKTCYQAVRADGIPLCLFCSGPVEFAERLKCSDWDKRFCSHDCKKEYQVRVNGTAARRALFEAERGVCQLCCLDAHSLYLGVTALHIRDRPAYLAQTPYASLPQQTLKKMVMQPKEGMFWEADHITPVSEGGGECGLDNLRTLCVMCHRRETGELNRRLKQYKALQHAAGYADISTFFRPLN